MNSNLVLLTYLPTEANKSRHQTHEFQFAGMEPMRERMHVRDISLVCLRISRPTLVPPFRTQAASSKAAQRNAYERQALAKIIVEFLQCGAFFLLGAD